MVGDTDEWTFSGTSGQTVTIALIAEDSDLDPMLEIVSPSGSVEASDDDGGTAKNSLIDRWALLNSGTYTIVAKGWRSTTGKYSLARIHRRTPMDGVRKAEGG